MPLRRLTAPPCALSLANYETNVFYWPAKAQFFFECSCRVSSFHEFARAKSWEIRIQRSEELQRMTSS